MTYFLPFLILLLVMVFYGIMFSYARRKILFQTKSPLFGMIRVLKADDGGLKLSINGYVQGISTDSENIAESYWGVAAQKIISHIHVEDTQSVLTLGMGANTTSNLVKEKLPHAIQDIVEIDENIIQICKQYFNLKEDRWMHSICDDVYKFVKKKPKKKYDVIFVDIFNGKTQRIKTRQIEFVSDVMKFLKKNGFIMYNLAGNSEKSQREVEELRENLEQRGLKTKKTFIFDKTRGFENYLLTANNR